MLSPLSWFYNGPIGIGYMAVSSVLFPILQRLGLWQPEELSFASNDMRGKVVIVTGSNTGIGRSTAFHISKMGATVILACRDPKRSATARDEMETQLKAYAEKQIYDHPFAKAGKFLCMALDLNSFASIETFAQEFRRRYKRLDALVCNAGVANAHGFTKEGFERHMGVNYLGHFYLVKLLMAVLKETEGARIVNVSSVMHEFGCLDFEGSLQGRYRCLQNRLLSSNYADSKLAMVLMTLQLRHQLKGTSVRAIAVSPGAVASDIWRRFGHLYRRFFLDPVMAVMFLNNDQGAYPSAFAATHPLPLEDEEDENDVLYYMPYYTPSRHWLMPFEAMGPFAGYQLVKPRLPVNAKKVAQELWWLSEKAVLQHAYGGAPAGMKVGLAQ